MEVEEPTVSQSQAVKKSAPMSKGQKLKRKREEQIQQESSNFDAQICEYLHSKVKGTEIKLEPDKTLTLFLNQDNDWKLLKQFSKMKIPRVSSIILHNAPLTKKHFIKFVVNSVPIAMKRLHITGAPHRLETEYSNLLVHPKMATANSLSLNCFKSLNDKQLKRLFKTNRHKESLAINSSTFSLSEESDFSDCFRDATLQRLNFCFSKMDGDNDFNSEVHCLDSLVCALSKSPDLHRSIEEIFISSVNSSHKLNKETLNKYGFEFE
ncbi:unnamed protein product [Moneuplotes crassus]|uniref:Uncharacterized protein n=1 Tax=Euplotes crassus TaxID=5936 RepID=A0AAD1TZT5_EUPCR|nr:unnamed protein product [Moneuplotes crassus]